MDICAAGGEDEAEENVEEDGQVRNPWKNKTAWLILLFFGLQTSLFFSLTTWLSPIAQEQGFSLVTASAVLTTMSLVANYWVTYYIPMLIGTFPSRIMWLYILLAIGSVGAGILFI